MTAVTIMAQERYVDVSGSGARKFSVSVNVANADFAKCLARNLKLSGLFTIDKSGSIKVSGGSGSVRVEGMGKAISSSAPFGDAKSARDAARKLSDSMCEAFGKQKGFACDRIVFLNRGGSRGSSGTLPGEICVTYPDGYDIRQLTRDGKMTVFPRWMKDGETILFIGDLRGAPQIWEMNTATGKRNAKWSFKGTPTGIAVSPDGTRVAAVLSFQGNPELYVISNIASANPSWTRLTNTKFASEGQPTWSPDGKKIAYVSDETRSPQIYVIDVASKAKRRLTSRGSQNIDPDWGNDGRIVYITKRGDPKVAVMSPAEGDASAKIVAESANWEHPSWSRDMRHVVASHDRALFVIDTMEGGDAPMQMFFANGNWISPTWVK